MPTYLDTRGRPKLSIILCGRCSEKFPYDEVFEDPNAPGLYVCKDDLDKFDPLRLPARASDDITLAHPRPDLSLAIGPQTVAINRLQAVLGGNSVQEIITGEGNPIAVAGPIGSQKPALAWAASSAYGLGNQVTIADAVGFAAAGTMFYLFICLVPGTSGATAPNWNLNIGAQTTDNTVIWLNSGFYLP